MQSELLSISKIFTENLFRIPDYQRGYSWTEIHLADFWNDIEQLEVGKNHYTGVLTLEQVSSAVFQRWEDDLWIIEGRGFVPYHIVDGQQRLTTIVILLQVILEKIPDAKSLNYTSKEDIRRKFVAELKDGGISRSYLFGYEKDNPSCEFLKTEIFLDKSDQHSTTERTIYTHNLVNAKKFFSEKLADLDLPTLERIYRCVTQNLLFNIYTISDDIDVCVAFETMNNRGKPLSHLELLKNRLIYLSTKLTVEHTEKSKLRSVVNECWKSAYHYLGRNPSRALSDDHFLETFFFAAFGPLLAKEVPKEEVAHVLWEYRHDDYYKRYLLNEFFISKHLEKADESTAPLINVEILYSFAQDLKETAKTYYYLLNSAESSFSNDEKIWLERLRRLGIKDYCVLLLIVYSTKGDIEVRTRLLSLLERIKFLRSIAPYIRDVENIDPNVMAIDLATGQKTLADIVKMLDAHLAHALQKVHFGAVFASWTKGYGYYGWKGVKYFMFEYELHLLSASKTNREKLLWSEFAKENFEEDYRTVEHIYPQKAADESWKREFGHLSIKQRNVLKHSIGNLVPLSKPKNSSLQNKSFSEKKGSEANKVGFVYGCYSEIEVSQCDNWTPREILTRGLRLLDFLERRWGFHLGSTQEKVKALSLQFVTKESEEVE